MVINEFEAGKRSEKEHKVAKLVEKLEKGQQGQQMVGGTVEGTVKVGNTITNKRHTRMTY